MKSIKLASAAIVAALSFASLQVTAAPMFTLTDEGAATQSAGSIGDFGAPGKDNTNIDNDVIIDLYGNGTVLSGFFGADVNLNSTARLTFEFLGKEAGYTNTFDATNGVDSGAFNTSTSGTGDSFSFNAGPGLLDFDFKSYAYGPLFSSVSNGANNTSTPTSGVADFFVHFINDFTILIAFDDGYPDDNHDDLVLKITAIPEPSSLALLGLGLIGLGLARRKA